MCLCNMMKYNTQLLLAIEKNDKKRYNEDSFKIAYITVLEQSYYCNLC